MNSKRTLVLSWILLAATPGLAQTDEPKKPAAESPKAEMKQINGAARAISRFLKDPKGDAPIAKVHELQRLVMTAKFRVPSLTAKQPEGDRAAFLKAYRKQINVLIRHSLDLEEHIEDKNWEKASAALAAMNKAKNAGHRKYKGRSPRRR